MVFFVWPNSVGAVLSVIKVHEGEAISNSSGVRVRGGLIYDGPIYSLINLAVLSNWLVLLSSPFGVEVCGLIYQDIFSIPSALSVNGSQYS